MSQQAVRTWRKSKKDRILLGNTGTIISWTEVFVAPPQFESQTPYTIVLVQLESGEQVYGELVDFEKSQAVIGQRVRTVLRKVGTVGREEVVKYGVKFIPV